VLSGILSSKFEIRVLDALAQKMSPQKCYQEISKINPETIIFLSGAVSWEEDKEFLKKIKEKQRIQLIGTGDIFLFDSENLLKKYEFLDAFILDFTSPEIVDFLAEKKRTFRNLIYRWGDRIIVNKKSLEKKDVFSLPLPRLDLFPLNKYQCPVTKFNPFATVIISLNCPYHCRFCTYGNLDFKWREVKNIIEELAYIHSLGIKEVRFKDNTFGANKNQVWELCQKMIENKFNFYWSCSSRIDILDENLLKLMKESGCHTIQFGVESGSQKILDVYNKGFTLKQVKKTFSLCHKLRIRTVGHFILGLPGENEKTILETIHLAKELKCDFVAFNIASPRIGTDLRKEAIEKKWLTSSDLSRSDSSLTYPVIKTEELSPEKLWSLRNKAIRDFYFRPSYIMKKILHLSSLNELKMLFRQAFLLFSSIFKKGIK
jgi:radical SAM superfamily enzyme YgiQ (UPF0313 family)